MRTITKTMKEALLAQAKEANVQGLVKIAHRVASEIDDLPIRDKKAHYVYEQDELLQDVEKALWTAAVRIQDFYGKTLDAQEVNESIESLANDLIDDLRRKSGSVIGAYEGKVPGEQDDISVED